MSRMTAIVGPPSQNVSGTAAVMTARPRSATNIIRRRSQRSAYAPAGSPIRRSGRVESPPTIPNREPRAGQREHQQRECRVGDRVAERADALADEDDLE